MAQLVEHLNGIEGVSGSSPLSSILFSEQMKPCYWPVEQLPGLSQENANALKKIGIHNTQQLLERANSKDSKQQLANQLGLKLQYVNKWVALADLARLPSVGCVYCGLLLHSGVGSLLQLSQTPAYQLHARILRFQVATMQRKDLCPPVERVQQWIQQGRSLVRSSS